jgi:hypothetical protein
MSVAKTSPAGHLTVLIPPKLRFSAGTVLFMRAQAWRT